MKRLVIKPYEFPCTLNDCEPGLFVFGGEVCMKTDYGTYFNCVGEVFWGGG